MFGRPVAWQQALPLYLDALAGITVGDLDAAAFALLRGHKAFMPTPAEILAAVPPRSVDWAAIYESRRSPFQERTDDDPAGRCTPEQAADVLRRAGYDPDALRASAESGQRQAGDAAPWKPRRGFVDDLSVWQRVPMPAAVAALDGEQRCRDAVARGVPLAEAVRRLQHENVPR